MSGDLAGHAGMNRAFAPGRMTLGVITPVEGFDGAVPGLHRHVERVRRAEQAGFASVWVRDVPLLTPGYGDAGQTFDPWVYLGLLAAHTSSVSLGTASLALPLRHPLHVAKAAASVQELSGGRMLLGVSRGDRPVEYPAFGVEPARRSESLVESLSGVRAALEESTVDEQGSRLLPRTGRLPLLMTGRGGQRVEWIAEHADGWLFFGLELEQQRLNIKRWRRLTEGRDGVFKPFAQSGYVELREDPHAPVRSSGGVVSAGREPLLELLGWWRDIGVNQHMLNLKPNRRPIDEVLDEFAEHVLPHFPPVAAER